MTDDPLATAKGIIFGLQIMIPFWAFCLFLILWSV